MRPCPRIALAAVLALAASMVSVGCAHPASAPAAPENHYVDAARCANCHAAIAATYRQTGMARAFYTPAPEDFPASRPFHHAASDTWYRIIARDGRFYQRSWQIGPSRREESVSETSIDSMMGSGNHVRTYLHRTPRNTLVELPLAWYAEKGGYYAMNPGFDTPHPPASRRVGYDCMFCHNAYPEIPVGHDDSGSEPVFAANLPSGIDCQRCHGPGEAHIATPSKSNIVNPAKLSDERALDVCAQCHLETTSFPLPNVVRRFDKGPFDYQPGQSLSTFVLHFDHAPGTGHDDKLEIVSSVYRLRKSQCFLQSRGALTCTTCHNPHDIPHGPGAAAKYDKVCGKCHAAKVQTLVAAQSHPSDTRCTACHMPKRRTEDVVHAVVTDHLIQRRAPANPTAELAERHGPAAQYRGEVVPYGESEPIYTAFAQVSAKSNLEAGIRRLESDIETLKPARPEFLIELGDAYSATGQSSKAAEAYRRALAKRPNSALILRRLGDPLQATRVDPNDPQAWYDLGLAQSNADALRRAIALDPEFAEAHNTLGAVLAESGHASEAESEFQTALRLAPANAGAHGNIAHLLAERGDLAQAAWHYGKAGDSAQDQFNFAVTLARMNRLAEARVHLEAALKADPKMPEALRLRADLDEMLGRGR